MSQQLPPVPTWRQMPSMNFPITCAQIRSVCLRKLLFRLEFRCLPRYQVPQCLLAIRAATRFAHRATPEQGGQG